MESNKKMTRSVQSFCLFVLLSFGSCVSPEIEEIAFPLRGKLTFLSAKSKEGAKFLDEVRKLEDAGSSYTGDFEIRIQNFVPKKDIFSLNGKIYYDKPSGKMQIELTDRLFGISVSKVYTDGELIRIKTATQDKIHEQPMDDIIIADPNGGKQTVVPFPVIYHLLSNRNVKLFQPDRTLVHPKEGIILVRKSGEEWTYYVTDKGIATVEWNSSRKNVKALTSVQGTVEFPPKLTLTRIVSREDGSDQNRIEIKMKRTSRTENIASSLFGF
ncbi:putative lipoprotein [Leptospira fainei serovar Hurstbridge str. BUT 6]|uniref:Lipoprotein n=2 Tax=Leptospira fainei TaxID=48782 RepID=S3V5Q9_9LEPT|nr:putative lipoprotein [Leptospira fainei serovar Hurstbridge str. BUT 6]